MKDWSGDLSGAVASALIAIPGAMSLGVLVFGALGPSYAAMGVAAALLASVIGNLVAAALPAVPCQNVTARASATVVFAGIVGAFAAHPLFQTAQGVDVPNVLALAFATLFVAGLLQIVFAVTGLGYAMRFVPHPVVAGFMNGIALVILLSQVAPALGAAGSRPALAALADVSAFKAGALLATVAVLASTFIAKRYVRRVPEAFCGLLAGLVVHYAMARLFPGSVGPVVGALPAFDLQPAQLGPLLDFPWAEAAPTWAALLVPNALLLAAVIALDGLLASMMADSILHTQHNGKRVLLGQGLSNMVGAAFGALPALENAHTRVATHMGGGRTSTATFLHAIFILLALAALAPVVAVIPVAALAGLMIYIGISLMDRWTNDLVRRLRAQGEHRREIAINVAIVAVVALALPLFNIMVAFMIGVSATILLLVAKISRTPVRRIVDGAVRTSLKFRSPSARASLQQLAHQVRVVELEGAIFFGTAEALRAEMERLPDATRYVVLDFRRVHEIDASGARMLQLISDRTVRRGIRVVLSHVREQEPHGKYLRAFGMSAAVPVECWFPDLDRALEWVEDRLLDASRFEDAPEVGLGQMGLLAGLDDAQLRVVSDVLERHEFGHGEVVFQEGDAGDRLYLIARGYVSLKIALEGATRAARLATFCPGVFFGEIAMIEGKKRSSDAFAKGDRVVLYSLSSGRMDELVQKFPQIALTMGRNLQRELAARLRATSQALRALE